jgi:transposase-like protein DUF772/DDE family transposase
MSTRMDGIHQPSLFSRSNLRMDVLVVKGERYRILAEHLPWVKLAEVANKHRSKTVDVNNGRPLDLRLHLGAMISQSMNGWTDRETEEMVRLHAGVRLLCGLEQSNDTTDHTSIVEFRAQVGKDGIEELNQIVVSDAKEAGFTDGRLCSSDTTAQESPIAYPTEVGHMKNIADKLIGIGSKIHKGMSGQLKKMGEKVMDLFTEIRLFTRGKGEAAIKRKKALSKKLQQTVAKMERLLRDQIARMGDSAKSKYNAELDRYRKMLSQIRQWQRTGFHPDGKLISLWDTSARAITRNKSGKTTEFGRRWIITKLTNGYIIGTVCKKLGSDSDSRLMPEILEHFERTMGESPKTVVYDRGGDGPKNHRALKAKGITNCIFRKGRESQPDLGRNTRLAARRERALSEATIATVKSSRYGFNKPRARSSDGCILKGQFAILGANLVHLTKDLGWAVG